MILYCDSSALLKLYVAEEDSESLARAAGGADALAVCRITYAEAMAGLARRERERPRDGGSIGRAKARFDADWSRFLVMEIDQALVEQAGELADTFALRAYDSIQLAAVRTLHRHLPGEVRFACFDLRLRQAAKTLDIRDALEAPA